jgi:hypothetical protein
VCSRRPRFLLDITELRNRIYDYAVEEPDIAEDLPYFPLMRPSAEPCAFGVVRTKNGGLRIFFALTQTCSQIRAEYRPLWLRNSKPRLAPRYLSSYFRTFYPTTQDLQHAPHELQISWHHDVPIELAKDCVLDNRRDRDIDVTPLLKMRVHRSDFRARVVSHKSAENILPDFKKLYDWQCEYGDEMEKLIEEGDWDDEVERVVEEED